jgi:glycosyltransferase involved in cell wall biosynthesis
LIRTGFLFSPSAEWLGGYNYLRNLLYAVKTTSGISIEPVVFVPDLTSKEQLREIAKYAEVIRVSVLRRGSVNWFVWRLSRRVFGSDLFLWLLLRKYKIEVFSHSDLWRTGSWKVVNWIPDFQHLHLPEMFSQKEIYSRNIAFRRSIQRSDLVILSSEDARRDLEQFWRKNAHKARVLRFVAQTGFKSVDLDTDLKERIIDDWGLRSPFFYLPNQFWKHKNHLIVFEALAILKARGLEPMLVCTGKMDDYRNKEHVNNLKNFLSKKNLNVKLLGVVPFEVVEFLMQKSLAVINPSLFEGWSTTVEECKSFGKRIILSNIPVHVEQDPPNREYFDPRNAQQLSNLLEAEMKSPRADDLNSDLDARTKAFAEQYQAIVSEAIKLSQRSFLKESDQNMV